jgi:hypothetical protein
MCHHTPGHGSQPSYRRHRSIDDIKFERDEHNGFSRGRIEIDRGETAEDPSSTKRVIHGPAEITYYRWDDGAIDAIVSGCPYGAPEVC